MSEASVSHAHDRLTTPMVVPQADSAKKQAALDQWRNAFRDEAKGGEPDPGTVLDGLLALRSVDRKMQEQQRRVAPRLPPPSRTTWLFVRTCLHTATTASSSAASASTVENSLEPIKDNSVDVKGNLVDGEGNGVDVREHTKTENALIKGNRVEVKGNTVDVK
eukprot:9116363-Pyramimonas_sp.AAC.1